METTTITILRKLISRNFFEKNHERLCTIVHLPQYTIVSCSSMGNVCTYDTLVQRFHIFEEI